VIFSAAWALAAAWGWTHPPPDPHALDAQRAALAQFAPALALSMLAGLANGIARRERVTAGDGYSSPMRAWIAKRVALAGATAIAAWATAPLSCGGGLLWASSAALFIGLMDYVGNLPGRL